MFTIFFKIDKTYQNLGFLFTIEQIPRSSKWRVLSCRLVGAVPLEETH